MNIRYQLPLISCTTHVPLSLSLIGLNNLGNVKIFIKPTLESTCRNILEDGGQEEP